MIILLLLCPGYILFIQIQKSRHDRRAFLKCRILLSACFLPRLPEDAADWSSFFAPSASLHFYSSTTTTTLANTTLLLLYSTTTTALLSYFLLPTLSLLLALLFLEHTCSPTWIHSRRYSYFPAWFRNGRTHFDERVQILNPRRLGEHRSTCFFFSSFLILHTQHNWQPPATRRRHLQLEYRPDRPQPRIPVLWRLSQGFHELFQKLPLFPAW